MNEPKHVEGPSCPSCDKKLLDAHPILCDWFKIIKIKFKDCHISWSFRDEKSQNEAYAEGKSKAPWPKSKHNTINENGPCSQALDLFQIASNGMACWVYTYFRTIRDETLNHSNFTILWGGDFNTASKLEDYDHFELKINTSGN